MQLAQRFNRTAIACNIQVKGCVGDCHNSASPDVDRAAIRGSIAEEEAIFNAEISSKDRNRPAAADVSPGLTIFFGFRALPVARGHWGLEHSASAEFGSYFVLYT